MKFSLIMIGMCSLGAISGIMELGNISLLLIILAWVFGNLNGRDHDESNAILLEKSKHE